MAFDGIYTQTEVEKLWKAFGDYVCMPYANNPERLQEIKAWFDDLYMYRDVDGLELSYNLVTGQDGKTSEVFCLNDQAYFSHDIAVRKLPCLTSDLSVHATPAKIAAFWLHDFGPFDETTQELILDNIWGVPDESVRLEQKLPPYTQKILDTVLEEFKQGYAPTDKRYYANYASYASYNIAPPRIRVGSHVSPDHKYYKFHPDVLGPQDYFNIVMSHALWKAGTVYALLRPGRTPFKLKSPPGSTGFHVMTPNDGGGIEHAPGWDRAGRAALIAATKPTRKLSYSPAISITRVRHPAMTLAA